jgi:hypothetical protein
MHQVSPSREPAGKRDFETKAVEECSPFTGITKRAGSGASLPLAIVKPAHSPIPPGTRYILVNQSNSILAQHAAGFAEHRRHILCVMQHVTEQHCID